MNRGCESQNFFRLRTSGFRSVAGPEGEPRLFFEGTIVNWTTVSPLEFQPVTSARFPRQPLHHLDTLWIQVAGTLCNLECTHCFVASGPRNHRHGMMPRAEVRRRVAESLPLGVKEFYFTGGEPFAHPEIVEILADTLEHGPSTALTNGTLFGEECVARIAALAESSRYA